MNTKIINAKESCLRACIEGALIKVIDITNTISVNKPQEPDYIAGLIDGFANDFFEILVRNFPDYEFAVSSVYCHQKPIVDIKLNKKVELGDILFVYVDRRENDDKIINSLLLQAKMSSSPTLKISQKEKHQLELYKHWPEFEYYRAGDFLKHKKRNIFPKTIHDGAQYLLINRKPLNNDKYLFPMYCAVPDENLCINDSLSQELINLLKFKSGRTIDNTPYLTMDDWSKMIWDLLLIAIEEYSRRKNCQKKKFPRLYTQQHCFKTSNTIKTLFDDNCGICSDYNHEINNDDLRGVSVILIESMLKKKECD